MTNYFNTLFNFFNIIKNSFFTEGKQRNEDFSKTSYVSNGSRWNGDTQGQKGCFGQSAGQKRHKERIKKYS